MTLNPNRKTAILLFASDVLSVLIFFNFVTVMRGLSTSVIFWPFLTPAMIFVISIHLIDGYGANADMMSLDYASVHLIATFSAAIATTFLTFSFIPSGFELQSSRAVIFISFGFLAPVTLFYRRLYYKSALIFRGERNLVFVGTKPEFDAFRLEFDRMEMHSPLIHADSGESYKSFLSVIESISSSKIEAEAIVFRESGLDLPGDIPMQLVQLYFSGVPTYTLEIFHQVYWRKIPLYRINPVWLFQEGFQIAREPVFERIKRISDIALSCVGLLLAAIPIAVAAIAIKLDDGGPVFFAQSRIGRHRVPFKLLKLRTMRESKEAGDKYTQKGDSRITRVGKLLRSARLDELPQLVNVLRGQMSLIGPRAEWDRLVAEYEKQIPSYHFRHLVKPGITGWAQVNYRYGANLEDTLRKLEYDLYYIRNFSFMLDASIVLKTLHVMLLQKGR